jgi:rhodanese-related sulfurtransferase
MTEPTAITVAQLAAWRDSLTPHTLLDVREASELAICALPGALHMPMQQVPARFETLPTDHPLVVMCHHGGRSQMVVNFLRKNGHNNAINLAGGIDAWSEEIDPSIPRY